MARASASARKAWEDSERKRKEAENRKKAKDIAAMVAKRYKELTESDSEPDKPVSAHFLR